MQKLSSLTGTRTALMMALPLLGAIGATAHAHTMGAAAGATGQADSACFDRTWSGVVQNCPGTRGWNVYLPIDGTNTNYAPGMYFYVPYGQHIGCNSVGMSQDHKSYWATPLLYNKNFWDLSMVPGVVWVPLAGDVYVSCLMDQGAVLKDVNW